MESCSDCERPLGVALVGTEIDVALSYPCVELLMR